MTKRKRRTFSQAFKEQIMQLHDSGKPRSTNRHKYSVSAMCAVLQIPRSTYYYEAKIRDQQDEELTNLIVTRFKNRRDIYGQRKIKKELEKHGWQVSHRHIGRIMKGQGLVSKYTVA